MIKTGELLRKAREEKGFSLNEVALSLKISSKILKAIETGDETQLPAKTFLRGFVQSYAAYLRLDVDKVMATFFEEVGTTRPKPLLKTAETAKSTEESSSPPESQKNQDHLAPINQKSNTKTVIVTVVGIILVSLILFTKKMIDKYTKEAQVDSPVAVTEPLPETAATPTPTPSPTETEAKNMSVSESATPSPSPSAVPPVLSKLATPKEITPAPSPAPTVTPATSPSKIPTSTPTPTPSASPSPIASVALTPTPTPSASPSVSPSLSPEKSAAKSVELIIEALDNVEIEYSSIAGKKSTLKLNSEQVHTFKSKNGLKLNISNGGAVNLILNGRDLGIPGDLGKPINLSY